MALTLPLLTSFLKLPNDWDDALVTRSEAVIAPLKAFVIYLPPKKKCVHMTSRPPCWGSKQRNGGHVGRVKYFFGD